VKLLALDTATEQCSAALWLEGVVSVREAQRSSGHGELILSMIDGLLSTA
jgi:tRNA threonylcarbamoyladenosine biosynthesis protein TsaB